MEKSIMNEYIKKLWNAKHTEEIYEILKKFEYECVSKKPETSAEALPIGGVVGQSEQLVCDHPPNMVMFRGNRIPKFTCKKCGEDVELN